MYSKFLITIFWQKVSFAGKNYFAGLILTVEELFFYQLAKTLQPWQMDKLSNDGFQYFYLRSQDETDSNFSESKVNNINNHEWQADLPMVILTGSA